MHRFDPFEHGIYRRFRAAAGHLNSTAWNHAVEGGEHVGTCRHCGGYLLGEPTHQAGNLTWYSARCTGNGCGRSIAAPNANYLRRSSRHTEMPEGYWVQRTTWGA